MASSADDRLAEGLAREARAYLAAIVESSDDAIISKDLNGIIRSCNAAAERIFGYPADELIGQSVLKLIPSDRLQEEDHILSRIRNGDRVDHFETVRRTKDGRLIDISLTVSAVRDGQGNIIGASKVARDITERRRSAAALAAQQAWFRITLGSIGDAVITCTADACVSYLNASAERLTGWSAEAAVGQPFARVFRIIDEVTRQPASDPAAEVLRTGGIVQLINSTLLIARDGTECPIADSAAPIRDATGTLIGVVVVCRDVSHERRIEHERQTAVADRERLLAAERAARTEAERASRIKDEFLAMVSHELRTPLNAILGWAQLMSRSMHDVTLLEQGLDVVARNTRLQAQLVSDLLDISRIVEGKLGLDLQSLDLRRVVSDAVTTVEREAVAKQLTLSTRSNDVPAPVVGDPARLQQVIWNLLSNAIKFTSPGGEIEVSLEVADNRAQVVVVDNGAGIRAEVLPHIFDRFHQADRSVTRRFGGLGLGLAIVKHLTELHGGHVEAESAGEGRGARFTVTFPLGSLPPREREAGPAAGDVPGEVSLEGVRVMVVEDEPDTQQFLKRLIEGRGATVVTAGSVEEALRQFAASGADVVISDIGLPGVDGYELMRQMRLEHRVAAIALTAYARPEDRMRALRAGYQAHVAKPVDGAELLTTIARLIEGAGTQERRP